MRAPACQETRVTVRRTRHRPDRWLLSILGPMIACQAAAQAAADKPVMKLVVPFAAGTPTDVTARMVAQGMAKSLGRTVIVDNRPGAAGSIATEAVAKAPADGNTVLLTVNSTVTINPILYTRLRYDPMKDLAPVALVGKGGYLLVTSPKSGLGSVGELVKAARERPGKVNYASYGVGSMSHMCAEMFQAVAGVRLFHVPYKAGSMNDILGGQVDAGFEPMASAIPHVAQKKLNGLATTSAGRVEALPGVPALGEAFPGYECTGWVGVLVPAKTPGDVRGAIESAVLKVAATAEFSRQMKEMGSEAVPGSASDFGRLVREDHEKWQRVLAPLHLQLD